MSPASALALAAEAEARLWSPEGAEALAYLTGPRCLSPKAIRSARLGWTPRAEGCAWRPPGVVIPWFRDGRLAMVKVRPPDAWREKFPEDRRSGKYLEAFRDRPTLYPGPDVIRPGRPLVLVEGEFDALLLGEVLADLASVVTLGGTGSTKPEPEILGSMLAACPWYIATDADAAGEKAAARWEATRGIRVRPPSPYKDWTEARQDGVDLRRWWTDRLGGEESPPLFTYDEMARWPGLDPEPGIVIDRPDPGRRHLALEALGTGPGDAYEPGQPTEPPGREHRP